MDSSIVFRIFLSSKGDSFPFGTIILSFSPLEISISVKCEYDVLGFFKAYNLETEPILILLDTSNSIITLESE